MKGLLTIKKGTTSEFERIKYGERRAKTYNLIVDICND